MTLDLTRLLMLTDGTPLALAETDLEGSTFGYPTISVTLETVDPNRVQPDIFYYVKTGHKNATRSFRLDNGEHVYGWGSDRVVNRIDWTQPIELDDGTPVTLVYNHANGVFADLRLLVPHASQPSQKLVITARRASGLVISNHKYHVRNRAMTKTIDTTKPLEVDSTRKVTFITETSEGHILVSIGDARASWFIFDKQGKYVRSSDGSGSGLTLRNKVERVVLYQTVASQPKGYILGGAYNTEAEARGYTGKQVVRVTSENGVVVSVELLS